MGFASFMASTAGRWLRIVAGLALLGGGIYLATSGGTTVVGIVLALVGLIPLLAGVTDVCVFAPLFGAPFSGPKIRAKARS